MALTDDGRPVCGSCGTTPKVRHRVLVDGNDARCDAWGWRPCTAEEYEQTARAGGWHIGATPDGQHDAMCPRCARPDPALVRLCRELGRD